MLGLFLLRLTLSFKIDPKRPGHCVFDSSVRQDIKQLLSVGVSSGILVYLLTSMINMAVSSLS